MKPREFLELYVSTILIQVSSSAVYAGTLSALYCLAYAADDDS